MSAGQPSAPEALLEAEFELGFTYSRTLGPVIGTCFAALANHRFLGIRRSDGSVLIPPLEYDPDTAESLSEWVELGDTGTVEGYCWVKHPREKHNELAPFAWALIKLDGADTPFLHKVRVPDESVICPGLRVKPLWVAEPQGDITDIAAFVPASEVNS